jgi:hypothetical protein
LYRCCFIILAGVSVKYKYIFYMGMPFPVLGFLGIIEFTVVA